MAGLLLDVDASDFVTASSSATTAASTAETAAATLRSALSSSSQMAGSDQNGVKWAGQYDKVAADAVRGLDTVITMLGGVSTGLAVSGANYATADWLSAGHTGTAPGHTIPPLPAMVCSAAPPSASGGSRHSDIPGFDLVANFIGDLWPDGDTGKLRSTKTAWDALADSLSTLHSTGITKVSSALEGSHTPEMPAIHSTITTVSTAISNLATEARTIGKACGDFADQIDTVHQQTEKELQSLLDQIAATAALSIGLTIFTAGLSDAAGAAAAATETGIAVSRILSFIAELGTTVARTIDEIATVAGSLAKVAGISETITIRVVTIAGKSVVTGLGGAVSNVAVTEITDPGANISDAALTGFIAGAGFSALGDGTKMAFAAKDARALYNSTTAGKMAMAEKTLARSAKTFTDNATAARWGARVWNKEAQALPKENNLCSSSRRLMTSWLPEEPISTTFPRGLDGWWGVSIPTMHLCRRRSGRQHSRTRTPFCI